MSKRQDLGQLKKSHDRPFLTNRRIHGTGIFTYMKTIKINHSCRYNYIYIYTTVLWILWVINPGCFSHSSSDQNISWCNLSVPFFGGGSSSYGETGAPGYFGSRLWRLTGGSQLKHRRLMEGGFKIVVTIPGCFEQKTHPLKLTFWTWKYQLGKGETSTNHHFLGSMLVFGGVNLVVLVVYKGDQIVLAYVYEV